MDINKNRSTSLRQTYLWKKFHEKGNRKSGNKKVRIKVRKKIGKGL